MPSLPGQLVTITGYQFGGSGTVYVNNHPALTQTWTDSYIVFPVSAEQPDDLGNGVLKVFNLFTNSTSPAFTFTFQAPVLSATVSPSTVPCAGFGSVRFTGSNFGTNVTIYWNGTQTQKSVQTATTVDVRVSAGAGGNLIAWAQLGNSLRSNIIQVAYSAPQVSRTSPAFLNTPGGPRLTVQGSNFGTFATAGNLTATVGGLPCVVQQGMRNDT